jgi:enoyl-[acyl-carrier protein] reductase I
MGLLKGKKGLIMGVANENSIAWGIAQECAAQGADLAFSYQGEALKGRVQQLSDNLTGNHLLFPCDVSSHDSITAAADYVKQQWGGIDFIIHSIAHSDKKELSGRYLDTSVENFKHTLHISCFSLVEVCKAFEEILSDNGSVITLTYYGSEKVMPNYNVMGVAKAALEASTRYLANDLGGRNICVNAISAGPLRTLSAYGIQNFSSMLKQSRSSAPLEKNLTTTDIGQTAAFLVSDHSRCITGQVIYVDCGYSIMGCADAA